MASTRAGIIIISEKTIGAESLKALLSVDYNVHLVSDREAAIEVLKANDIDFLMMDVSKNTEELLEFTADIKQSAEYYSILIGIASDSAEELKLKRFVKAGACYAIQKPLDPSYVKNLVDNVSHTFIEERKEEKNRYEEELERIKMMTDTLNAGLMVISGQDGPVIKFMGRFTVTHLGYEEEESLRFTGLELDKLLFVRDQGLFERKLKEVREKGAHVRFEVRLRKKNGSYAPFEINIKNIVYVFGVPNFYAVLVPMAGEDFGRPRGDMSEHEILARLDPLTGIYNKETFLEETLTLLNAYPEKEYVVSVWDIDRFKAVNELFGSKAGDKVIEEFGDLLKATLDPKISTFGRIESDHFVTCCTARFHQKVEKQIEDIVNARHKWHSLDYTIFMHAGMYKLEPGESDIVLACDRAFMALQAIKDSYIYRINYFTKEMRDSLVNEQQIVRESETALLNNEFYVSYQPIVDSRTKAIVAAEALVRWKKPDGTVVIPGDFIPTFEKNGFVSKLDMYIWEEVCKFQAKRKAEGKCTVPISVNFSRIDFYNARLYEDLTAIVKNYGLDHRYIKVEVTESAYMDQPQELMTIMNKFRSAGYQVLMDDFGSGFSSLNMLKDFEVDILKIDMKFLDSIDTSERASNILYSIIQMAKVINMQIVAEGVENINQYEMLKNMNCDCIQGYYFFKPMRDNGFAERLDHYDDEISKDSAGKYYKLLFLSNDEKETDYLKETIDKEAEILKARSLGEAEQYLEQYFGYINLAVVDLDTAYEEGIRFLDMMTKRGNYRETRVLVFAGTDIIDSVAHYINEGVLDIVSRPFNKSILKNRLRRAMGYQDQEGLSRSLDITGKNVHQRQQMNSFFEQSIAGIARVIVDISDDLAIRELPYINDKFLNIHGLTLEEAASKEKLSGLLARVAYSETDGIDKAIKNAVNNREISLLKEYNVERHDGSMMSIVAACTFKYMEDVVRIDFILLENDASLEGKMINLVDIIMKHFGRGRGMSFWRYYYDSDIVDRYFKQEDGRYARVFSYNVSKNPLAYAGVEYTEKSYNTAMDIIRRLKEGEKIVSGEFDLSSEVNGKRVNRWDRVTYYGMKRPDGVDFAVGIREDVTDEYERSHGLWRENQFLTYMKRNAVFFLEADVTNNTVLNEDAFEKLSLYGIREGASYDEILRLLLMNVDENDRDKITGYLRRKELIRRCKEGDSMFLVDFMGKTVNTDDWSWFEAYVVLGENPKTGNVECAVKIEKVRAHHGFNRLISEYDSLTGLYSRVMFEKTMNRMISEDSFEKGAEGAFVLINLDGFKKVNDLFGHNVGDSILKTIAKIIGEILGENVLLGRLGGDEFTCFIQRIGSREELSQKLSNINKVTRYEMETSDSEEPVLVTASIGGVFVTNNEERFHKLYPKAAVAVRRAKESGKNTFKFYENPL